MVNESPYFIVIAHEENIQSLRAGAE